MAYTRYKSFEGIYRGLAWFQPIKVINDKKIFHDCAECLVPCERCETLAKHGWMLIFL